MRFSRQIAALAAAMGLLAGMAAAARAEPQNVGTPIMVAGVGTTVAVTTAVYASGTGADQILVVADAANDRLVMVEVRTGEEVGAPLPLSVGCIPQDLLAVGGILYVACSGNDLVEAVDLSMLALPTPNLALLGTIAVGAGPDRLLYVSVTEDYLLVQNAVAKTVSVISLSSASAPIGINADDSSEVADTLTVPVGVRICGQDSMATNRGTPVGLGVGTERIYVACGDGLLSWFDPFNNMDFFISADLNLLGSVPLTAAQGRAGAHGFYLQAGDGSFYVVDLSEAEMGGNAAPQALYFDTEARFSVQGPAEPRGLLTFFDAETGSDWLALFGQPLGAQVDLFDVGDLGDEPYSAPMGVRVPDAQFSTGISSISAQPVRATFGGGNLFVPSRGAAVSVVYGGPLPDFTSPDSPLALSSLADPGLGRCDFVFPDMPLSVPWETSESVPMDGCTATLTNSLDGATLACSSGGTGGTAEISASAIAGLDGASEEMSVHLELLDVAGNAGFGADTVVLDGIRPPFPVTVTGRTLNDTLSLEWSPVTETGTATSGVRGYVLTIVRNFGSTDVERPETFLYLNEQSGTRFTGTIEDVLDNLASSDPAMPGTDPFFSGEIVWVSVGACDRAGNRSEELSPSVQITRAQLGVSALFGERGGCTMSSRGSGALLPFLLLVVGLPLFNIFRRRAR